MGGKRKVTRELERRGEQWERMRERNGRGVKRRGGGDRRLNGKG